MGPPSGPVLGQPMCVTAPSVIGARLFRASLSLDDCTRILTGQDCTHRPVEGRGQAQPGVTVYVNDREESLPPTLVTVTVTVPVPPGE